MIFIKLKNKVYLETTKLVDSKVSLVKKKIFMIYNKKRNVLFAWTNVKNYFCKVLNVGDKIYLQL